MCACVPVPGGLLHRLVRGAVRGCVAGPGMVPRPATPGWGVGACVCLCARLACFLPFLAGVCCVAVRAGLRSWLCPALLGWVIGVCVRSCVCSACPRPSWGAACGAGVCGCCRFLLFFFGGGACRVLALWCRWLVVPVSGVVVSAAPSPLFRPALLVFSFSVPAWCVSACFGCPFPRWAAAPGLVLPVLAGWSPYAPSRGPVFGAVWVRGLAASCGVGGRFGGSGPFSRSPRVFFGGGSACSSLCLPWFGIQCGLSGCCWWLRFARPCPGPMGRVGYVHVGLGAPSCRVRFWLCRLGGCARRLRVALG